MNYEREQRPHLLRMFSLLDVRRLAITMYIGAPWKLTRLPKCNEEINKRLRVLPACVGESFPYCYSHCYSIHHPTLLFWCPSWPSRLVSQSVLLYFVVGGQNRPVGNSSRCLHSLGPRNIKQWILSTINAFDLYQKCGHKLFIYFWYILLLCNVCLLWEFRIKKRFGNPLQIPCGTLPWGISGHDILCSQVQPIN